MPDRALNHFRRVPALQLHGTATGFTSMNFDNFNYNQHA
jgi:hypothetical protein